MKQMLIAAIMLISMASCTRQTVALDDLSISGKAKVMQTQRLMPSGRTVVETTCYDAKGTAVQLWQDEVNGDEAAIAMMEARETQGRKLLNLR